MNNNPVSIIGGGIGGLSMANALLHATVDFQLFEQAPCLTEVGAAIGISNASLKILDSFGLAEAVRNAGYPVEIIQFADEKLNAIRTFKSDFPGVIVHRARLIDILASKLPVENIHLNKRLVGVKCKTNSTLIFEDGTEIITPCAIVADGINSNVRKELFPHIKIRRARQVVWRGITAFKLPSSYERTYVEIWHKSKRFLFAAVDKEHVCWLAVMNLNDTLQNQSNDSREYLLHEYDDFHPMIKDLINHSSNFIRNEIMDLGTERRKWFSNSLVFIGDSIHATTPNLAQGGCQAIEDANCLALLLKKNPGNQNEVFEKYQKLREHKVSSIINTSWQIGKISHSNILSNVGKLVFRYAPIQYFKNQDKQLNDLSYLQRI